MLKYICRRSDRRDCSKSCKLTFTPLGVVVYWFTLAIATSGYCEGPFDLLSSNPILPSTDAPTLFPRAAKMLADEIQDDQSICDPGTCPPNGRESRSWHLLPDGLLWHSYLAGPQEPRISSVIFRDSDDGIFWDATVGGRVGLLRYGTPGANRPSGWQWDLEGAVFTRLDLLHAEDVESADYRFGSEITTAEGPWAMKLGYFHISSHVGDEYLVRNPTFQRINYVTESLVLGGSYSPTADIRLYAEFVNSFRASGGARRYQFQTGAEYAPVPRSTRMGAPFAAVHLNFRQAVDFRVSTTLQLGWAFHGPESKRRIRFGGQYSDGPTSQYSFFQRREDFFGLGVWFDY